MFLIRPKTDHDMKRLITMCMPNAQFTTFSKRMHLHEFEVRASHDLMLVKLDDQTRLAFAIVFQSKQRKQLKLSWQMPLNLSHG